MSVTGGSALPDGADVSLGAGGTLFVNGAESIGGLSGSGMVGLYGGSLTVGGTSDLVFSGALFGNGALVRAGTGSLSLGNSSSFQGGVYLSSGSLRIGNDGASVDQHGFRGDRWEQARCGSTAAVFRVKIRSLRVPLGIPL